MGDMRGGSRMGAYGFPSFEDTFDSPFGGGMCDMGGGSRMGASGFPRSIFSEDIFSSVRGARGETSTGRCKAPAIKCNLPCSLEDLYKGTTKKMKITRDVIDSSGRPTTVEEILTIVVKPGWKKGTKITFPEKGNEQRGIIPSDLVFIIDEKPHGVFKRDGNDLIVSLKISRVEALTGYTAQVTTLDGRNLTIPINNVISPSYEEVVKGEGMPIPKEPSKRGNLRIKLHISSLASLPQSRKLVSSS